MADLYDPKWDSMVQKNALMKASQWNSFSDKERKHLFLRFREVDIYRSVKDDNPQKGTMIADIMEKIVEEEDSFSEERRKKMNEFLGELFYKEYIEQHKKDVLDFIQNLVD